MMKMICAECGREMKSVNKPHDFRVHIIQNLAENAYQSEVIETQEEEYLIGPGNEYYDKEDWISCWIFESLGLGELKKQIVGIIGSDERPEE